MFHQQTMFCITNHRNIVIGLRDHLIQILPNVRMQENILTIGLMRADAIQSKTFIIST
jgi:hypothetical protein